LESQVAELKEQSAAAEDADKPRLDAAAEEMQGRVDELHGTWKRQSWLGRMGHAVEPAVKPLGWDWKIGMAALASFPAREVVVGTLGIIYNQGKIESDDEESTTKLGRALQEATWDDGPTQGRIFTVPTALSLMVFFALCCQCAS